MKKIIRKGFKFRLNPTLEQTQKFIEFSGVNRFVWNKALARCVRIVVRSSFHKS